MEKNPEEVARIFCRFFEKNQQLIFTGLVAMENFLPSGPCELLGCLLLARTFCKEYTDCYTNFGKHLMKILYQAKGP